jgi:hypothetical protein
MNKDNKENHWSHGRAGKERILLVASIYTLGANMPTKRTRLLA